MCLENGGVGIHLSGGEIRHAYRRALVEMRGEVEEEEEEEEEGCEEAFCISISPPDCFF